MTHREKLQEQYEEAVLALLIDEVAEQEGRELLAEAERLNRDPDAAIPEELDQKCRKIIRDSLRKRRRKTVGRVTGKVLQKVAVVAAALLFGAAYAAIPEFRVGVLNLMLTVTDVSTNLTLVPSSGKTNESVSDSAIYYYGIPQIPDGYELDYAAEEKTDRFYSYKNEDGDLIQVDFYQGRVGTNMGVDTENAQAVTDVVINGYAGICVEKDGTVQVVWLDADRQVLLGLYCTVLDKDTVMEMAQAMKYTPTGSADTAKPALDSVVYYYEVPEIPEGYELDDMDEQDGDRYYSFQDKENDLIMIEIFQGSTGTNWGVDTEDAQAVTNVVVNGYKGLCVEKDGTVHVTWVDTDRQIFVSLYCTALDKDTALDMAQAIKYTPPGT